MYYCFFFNSSYFSSVIQLSLFVRPHFSFPFVSSDFKNSLMSSSIFFCVFLPGLRVLIVSSSPGCASRRLFGPPFFWQGDNSSCHSPLQSSVRFNPARYLHFLHVFFGFLGTSIDVFNPSSFSVVSIARLCPVGRTHHCLDLCPSSDLNPLRFLCQFRTFPSSSYLLISSAATFTTSFLLIGSYFFFVCTTGRSILRCDVLIIFSCFCDTRPMCHLRRSLSAWWSCWKDVVCDTVGNLSTLVLAIFVERCPRCFQSVFDLFSFLLLELVFFVQDIAHCLLFLRPRFWCCWPWSLLPSLRPGYWVSSSCLGGFPNLLLLCWTDIHLNISS